MTARVAASWAAVQFAPGGKSLVTRMSAPTGGGSMVGRAETARSDGAGVLGALGSRG